MDSRLSLPRARRRGPWGARPWTLVVLGLLLVVGTLIQACSDNNGTTGPTFECQQQKGGVKVIAECAGSPAPTTGFANTSAEIRVQVGVNPNAITPGRRAGVTAFVTNLNGQPLAGRKVQFSTTVGTLDKTVVETNSAGQASTTLSITPVDAANSGTTFATVTAFVDGALAEARVNYGAATALALIPTTVTRNFGADTIGGVGLTFDTCSTFGPVTVTFTVSGGVPPLKFSTSGAFPGASVSSGGVYTAPNIGPVGINTEVIDTVTVTDAIGNTATATVNVKCVQPAVGP